MTQPQRALARLDTMPDADDDSEDQWLTGPEAARLLGLSERTLTRLRSQGDGPAFERSERTRKVRYRLSELRAWKARVWR